MAGSIRLLGFVERTEQLCIMKNAAFIVQPSLCEGWGTVLEDAKVLDKAVLLSDCLLYTSYLLSISCTGYVGGEFRAYHRLYDVVGVTVISDKNTVGFYDMNSETTVERVEE